MPLQSPFAPLYPGFVITKVTDFKDGTYGVTLCKESDPENILTHTGEPSYLKRVLNLRYGVEFKEGFN